MKLQRLYGKLSALVALVVGLPFAAAAEPDATLKGKAETDAWTGLLWKDTKLWVDGNVVSGNGVVIDTGNGSPAVRMDETNRVVGAFTTTYGTMPATGGSFMFSIVNQGFIRTLDFTPQRGNNSRGFLLTTNKLVFANNGDPAEIHIDDGSIGGDGIAREPFRHFYDVPIALEDDLVVRHLFSSTNQYGHYTIGDNKGPAAGVIFARPISGEGKGITIDNAASMMGVMFAGDNTFSGDLVVERGIARAIDTLDRPRAGTPFGVANRVVATSDGSGVDLGGFITGEGQTLVLKGMRTVGASHTNGVLFSTYGRVGEYSKWCGNVQLAGDTWIGGTLAGLNYPSNFYPADADGDIEVSGPISETDGPAAVHLVSTRNVAFGGTNTFSGGLYLDNGYFTARNAESAGTGGIVFNGGVYRAERQSDANVFEMDVAAAPKDLRVHVEAGVTNIVSSNWSGFGKGKFYKYGEGTMLLTNVVSLASKNGYICGGTVIFDTSKANFVKFGTGQDASNCDTVSLYLNSKIVVRGDPAQQRVGGWYGPIDSGSAVTLRVEDGQKFNPMFNVNNNTLGYVNFETDGSGAYFTKGSLSQGATHKYAGDAPLLIYEGSSFVKVADNKAVPMQDEDYSNTWGGATDCVDVTPTLAEASVPAGTSADVLRFNTPNGGSDLVLTLGGDLTIDGRTILVTPEMGNTTVRITGGKLRSTTVLRILNFNTSAPFIIESDIQGVSGGNLRVVTGGPGKTVLSGGKSFNDIVYVLGGELVTDCAGSLGSGTVSDKVYLCNGGILSFDGTFSPRSDFDLNVRMTGGAIKVPDPSDVVTLTKEIKLLGGAHFRKLGAGTLKLSGSAVFKRDADYNCNPNQMHVEYCEGKVESARDFSQATEFTLADNGVTLVGSRWLTANQGGAAGAGNRLEIASKRMLHIGSGGATVDVHGVTVSMNDTGNDYYYNFDRCPEFLSGEGELTVVDTDGEAELKSNGYRDASFRGKFTSYVPFSASGGCRGFELRNAEMHIPSGVTHSFVSIYSDRCNLWFGRLSGFGTLDVRSIKDTRPAYVILGQDDAPDVDFAGTLTLTYGDSDQAYPQLVKVGNNAQRISGSANRLDGNTIVRAGSLLAGNDSPATSGASGAFGAAMVFVGDEETPEGASPAFLIDGAYTVVNEIRVPDTSPASAAPVLGGTSNANGAVFSGPVKLRRDVAFMAGDGATVTFTGPITGLQGVSKLGGGRVRIGSDVSIGGDFAWSGGTLEVDGSVTVPDGATITLDESLCTPENVGKVFDLLSATGGINGRFNCSQEFPIPWRMVQSSGKVKLVSRGCALIYK